MSEDRFKAFLDQSLEATYCLAPANPDRGTFRFTDVNAAGAALMNATREELIGRTIHEVISEGNADMLSSHLANVYARGEASQVEVMLEGDSESRLMRAHMVPLDGHLVVEVYDITEARRAQDALRQSEEYLSSVIANAPIIMYELNRDGVFKLSAGRSLKQIGLAPGQAVGGSIFDFFPDDSPEVDAFRRALAGETVSTATNLGDGYFASRYTPRHDENGEIVGVLGVSYDITEQHQAEEQLRRAHRMEAVGQLTGGIAHDFNNLLAVILGNLDLLADNSALDARARDLIENAISATQRGATLTQRLLAFSRRQLLKPRAVDINELIGGMLDLLKHVIPENISIDFQAGDELWLTNVDAAQLENAILNLCVNARDAMPNGGTLDISTTNLALEAGNADRLELDAGDYVAINVTDTGTGIAADVAEKIFEPFFTTKETGKGSGLGLSMVYGFVNQSGGAIDLDTVPGRGTRIQLLLPRALIQLETASPSAEEIGAEAESGHGELVLVVEDDADLRSFVNEALVSLNYKTLEAPDGHVALSLLEEHDDIDLLLSDVILPGDINGLQLSKTAQQLRPELKVILTTGYLGEVGEADPLELAQMEHLTKPYRVSDLGLKLRQTLDQV